MLKETTLLKLQQRDQIQHDRRLPAHCNRPNLGPATSSDCVGNKRRDGGQPKRQRNVESTANARNGIHKVTRPMFVLFMYSSC